MVKPLLLLFAHPHKLVVHGRKVLSDSHHVFIGRLISLVLVISYASDGIILQTFKLSLVLLLGPHVKLLTMTGLLQLVDLLQKTDILFHDPSVLSLLGLFVLAEVLAQMLQVLFEIFPDRDESLLLVTLVLTLGRFLILDVDFVQLDNALLQLLVIGDLLQALKDVVFKTLNILVLIHNSHTDVLGLFSKSIKSHAQILLDQF
jgi:hypothetical protein